MNDLSLKGVARRYGSITGGFSVIEDIFGISSITGSLSLRSQLESMAREEHSFSKSECIFDWTAAFEQTWTHIRIRIRLNPDADVLNLNSLRNRWQNGIQNIWSDRWGCGRSGELTCPLTFEVVWIYTGQHHTVRVNTGMKCTDDMGNPRRCGTNKSRWHTDDSGNTAAHEFGHMLGLVDEYVDPFDRCPDRDPINTGTIMDHNTNVVPARMMTRFANNIGSNVVGV